MHDAATRKVAAFAKKLIAPISARRLFQRIPLRRTLLCRALLCRTLLGGPLPEFSLDPANQVWMPAQPAQEVRREAELAVGLVDCRPDHSERLGQHVIPLIRLGKLGDVDVRGTPERSVSGW